MFRTSLPCAVTTSGARPARTASSTAWPRATSSRSTCATNVPRSGAAGPGYICETSRMRTGPAYAGPVPRAAPPALRGGGAANDVDDEVGPAFEEQVEQAPAADEAGGTPKQGDEARLVQADGT